MTADRVAFVSLVAAAAAVAFVVLRTTGESAVRVNDERTRTRHALTLRRRWDGCDESSA
jgi:hypothetical protein